MHTERTRDRGIIASYVDPLALGEHTRAALDGLGYRVVQGATIGHFDDQRFRPRIRIIDDRFLSRLPSADVDPDTPVIVLSGTRPLPIADPRVVGHLQRPANLTPLYALIQQALEPNPRRSPRVDTALTARAAQSGRRFVANLASLSSQGCLLSETEHIDRGSRLNVEFAVPGTGLLMARAECVYELGSGYGLRFDSTTGRVRALIDHFVTQRLAARQAFV